MSSSPHFFGISRQNMRPPYYQKREGVDDIFIHSLQNNKHIVVFGSAKQGKTSLLKQYLDGNNIVVHCKHIKSVEEVYVTLLKEAGFEIEYNQEHSEKQDSKFNFGFKISALLGLSGDLSAGNESITKSSKRPIDFNIKDISDVIRALKSFENITYIILEDFHDLKEPVQREFLQHLKTFSERSSIIFIVTGNWLSEDRLVQLNRELKGHVVNINVDLWKDEELGQILEAGERSLGIEIPANIKEDLIRHSLGSVGVFQELCHLCLEKGISQVPPGNGNLNLTIYKAIGSLLKNYNAAFIDFVSHVKDKDDATVEYYKAIIYFILIANVELLRYGIEIVEIYEFLKKVLPLKEISLIDLHSRLKRFKDFQLECHIDPPFIEYDETEQRLHISDKFFLLWLGSTFKSNLLEATRFDIDWILRSKWLGA